MSAMPFQTIGLFLALFAVFVVLPVGLYLTVPPIATKAEYAQLQEGMTLAQARAIVGDEGVETAGEQSEHHNRYVFTWTNHDGSQLEAVFENGKLVSKRHERLP